MRKPTVAQLQAEIEALKKRLVELEARPAVVIHNHPPAHQPQQLMPYAAPLSPPWKQGDIWCGITVAAPAILSPLWNGPRNPDGSCAPLGSAMLTATAGGH